jgi:hypothetical protein
MSFNGKLSGEGKLQACEKRPAGPPGSFAVAENESDAESFDSRI